MALRTGIFPSRGHEIMALPDHGAAEYDGWPVFPDGRDGTDRWGRERAELMACGTGWGEDEWVCPAYVEEACPGEANGDREAPNYVHHCNLLCGTCGGAARADTMAYCGAPKGSFAFQHIIAELGGSLRLDACEATPQPPPPLEITKTWFPTVQWGVKHWMKTLNRDEPGGQYPVLATTFRSAMPGKRRDRGTGPNPLHYRQDIRERLGGFEGVLMVNGLTKDDLLDDVWDDLDRVMRFCRESRVDIMVCPQFSYYEVLQNCMTLVNTKRIFDFYRRIREEGFPLAVLDCPPSGLPWYRDEYLHFIERNEVKMVAMSYQTLQMRSGLNAQSLQGAADWNRDLPADVEVIAFGLSQMLGAVQLASAFAGRRVYFSDSNAYALAAFYKLMLPGQSRPVLAPPGMTKDEVFTRNVRSMEDMFEKVQSVVAPEPEEESPARRRAARRRERVRR